MELFLSGFKSLHLERLGQPLATWLSAAFGGVVALAVLITAIRVIIEALDPLTGFLAQPIVQVLVLLLGAALISIVLGRAIGSAVGRIGSVQLYEAQLAQYKADLAELIEALSSTDAGTLQERLRHLAKKQGKDSE